MNTKNNVKHATGHKANLLLHLFLMYDAKNAQSRQL